MSFRVISLLLVLSTPLTAFATDYHSPRAAGLGGAGHAAPLLNDGIYMNPAMMALLPAYSISASHESASGPDGSEPKSIVQNASIQDGTNSLFQAGVGYTRKSYGREINLGASTRILTQYGVGMGGKFLFGSDSRPSAQDATLSGVGGPVEWLMVGFTIDNVLETPNTKAWGQYREIILGTKANIQKLLLLYLDPHVVPSLAGQKTGYEAGVEIPLMVDLFIRAGLNKNSFQPHLGQYGDGFGFGAGWASPRISFDAAMTRTTLPVRTNNILFSITII
jgi:hypothetical protein